MKKRLMRCLSLLLCAVLLSVPALAAEPAAGEPARQGPVRVWGTVTWLDNGGLLVENSNESDPLHEVVLHGESIICLDAVTGESMELEQIKDGDTIYAWVGPAMTMSLPPQATAQVIVANIPADYGVPQYYEIASVTPQAMIAIYPPPALTWTEVTATDGTTLRITDEAELTPYRTKNIVRLEDLIPGTGILVWTDAQGQPERVLVFPYAYQGYVSVTEEGVVSVNGGAVAQKAKIRENGETLLPLRAVAEALGLQVKWDPAQGAVVSRNEETVLTAMPGGAIQGVDDAGVAYEVPGTCIVEEGVTYLSQAALLQLLDLYPAA